LRDFSGHMVAVIQAMQHTETGMSALDCPLGVFLRKYEVGRGEPCSVTGMGAVKGRWMIPDENYPEFFQLLHQYLFVDRRRPNNLVEQRRPDGLSPLLIDLDFKYSSSSAIERRFTMNHIKSFIRSYVSALTELFDLPRHGVHRARFFISLRPSPYEDKRKEGTSVKDGVHIQCPDIVLSSEHQQVLRQYLLANDAVHSAFDGTGFINPDKLVYDEAVAKSAGWFMYGESKPNIPAYSLQTVYVYNTATHEYTDEDTLDYNAREILELLSVRHGIRDMGITVRDEMVSEVNRLSGICRTPVPRGGAGGPVGAGDEKIDRLNSLITSLIPAGSSPDDVTFAKTLVERCLSADRADDRTGWMNVGWCLRAIDDSEEMFNVWLDWSSKSPKFTANNINSLRREWSRPYHGHTFTLRSLIRWAKEDNPAEFKRIEDDNLIQYVQREVEATHTHIARLMQRMYNDTYRAAVDSKKTDWFEFNDHSWRKLDQGLKLRNKMSTEVADVFERTKSVIKSKKHTCANETESDFLDKHIKKFHDIETKLYTAGFKDSVMKECIGLFYEEEFQNKLNSNPYLIGFANGVLNLRAERIMPDGSVREFCQFRDGRPDDHITYQAGKWIPKQCDPIPYVPYDELDPIQDEIDDFMSKVFPRPELRAYMWRKLASCLEGTNREQRYDTWIGVGGNGKSKLVDLMAMTLGDYATSLQSTVLTRKRPESGAANPDIMAVRNRRFIYMAEPDDGEPLNTSRMKQFTGEDVVEARGLFEDQSKFQITGKMFMLCNKFPAIHAMDRGTWRRVMAVPFESKFVDPESEEGRDIDPAKNVYPRDNHLDTKLKRWRVAFMARLVHVYETEYLVRGIEPIPAIVKQESENYRALFDSFGKFKQARIRACPGTEATLKELFRAYKYWYEQVGSAGGGKKLTMTELQKRLDDEFGMPADKKTYRRITVFDSDEDLEEWEREQLAQQSSLRADGDEPGAVGGAGSDGGGGGGSGGSGGEDDE
jgi:P4 family phage/plasmid primase-like protien